MWRKGRMGEEEKDGRGRELNGKERRDGNERKARKITKKKKKIAKRLKVKEIKRETKGEGGMGRKGWMRGKRGIGREGAVIYQNRSFDGEGNE